MMVLCSSGNGPKQRHPAPADSDWQARERHEIRNPKNPAKRSFMEKIRLKPLRLPELIVIYLII
jgi:hypothetical protein